MNKKSPLTSYTGVLRNISVPMLRALNITDITPEWLTGFTDAEGCLFLNIRENRCQKGYWASAGFSLVQHSRDLVLFKVIPEYLGYCNLVEENTPEVVRLRLENLKTITEQLIPFFTKNSLQTSKRWNLLDFCKACAFLFSQAKKDPPPQSTFNWKSDNYFKNNQIRKEYRKKTY